MFIRSWELIRRERMCFRSVLGGTVFILCWVSTEVFSNPPRRNSFDISSAELFAYGPGLQRKCFHMFLGERHRYVLKLMSTELLAYCSQRKCFHIFLGGTVFMQSCADLVSSNHRPMPRARRSRNARGCTPMPTRGSCRSDACVTHMRSRSLRGGSAKAARMDGKSKKVPL